MDCTSEKHIRRKKSNRYTFESCIRTLFFSCIIFYLYPAAYSQLTAPQAAGNIQIGPDAAITGSLPDASLSASGCWNGGPVNTNCSAGGVGNYEAWRGRLFRVASDGGFVGWAVDQANSGDYWQADLGGIKPVNGVISQGRADAAQWLTQYTVQLSIDNATWFTVPGTFTANTNQNTAVINYFGQYHARYVRVYTVNNAYSGHQGARFDVISIPEGSGTQTVMASAELVTGANTVRWYDAATGGTLLATGRVASFSISVNTTVYAESFNSGNGQLSATRTAVLLRVNDIYGLGPAGIGNTNGRSLLNLWLNSESYSAVTNGTASGTWSDLSGKGNNATQPTTSQRPTVQTSAAFNNSKVLRFDGVDDKIFTVNYFNGFYAASTPNPFSVFGVASYRGDNERVITSNTHNWLLGWHANQEDRAYFEGWVSGNCAGGGVTATNSPVMYTAIGNRVWSNLYKNGAQLTNISNTCGLASPGSVSIGGTPLYGESSDADVAEVITYDLVVNTARRKIIENYLHAKYNLAITGDIYDGDLTASGNFDYNVSGIGRESDGYHLTGYSAGLTVTTTVADFLKDNGDYILFGRNAATAVSWESANVDPCSPIYPLRSASRIWYLDKTDAGLTGGNVTMTFNFTTLGLGTPPAGTYHLLYRSSTSGYFTSVATTAAISGNDVIFTVNATSLADGQYMVAYQLGASRSHQFNGSTSRILVPSNAQLRFGTGNFTYEFWMKGNGFTTEDTYFESGTWAAQSIIFRQETPTQLYAHINGNSLLPFNFTPVAGRWYHMALTRNGSTFEVFVNGISLGARTFNPDIQPTTALYIGSSQHTTGQVHNGLMDEFRVWNTALTSAQLTTRMYSNITPDDALWNNLVAYYKMDEAFAPVHDLSQYENAGVPVNTTIISYSVPTATITGVTVACPNETQTYSATMDARIVSYNWIITGGVINSGQGTSQVTVTWAGGTQSLVANITYNNTGCQAVVASNTLNVTSLNCTMDWGDAIDPSISNGNTVTSGLFDYPTIDRTGVADDGPSQIASTDLTIGNISDADNGSIQSRFAFADDQSGFQDEDAFGTNGVPPVLLVGATSYSTTIPVRNNTGADAQLSAWIDFNDNGLFDASEKQTIVVPNNGGTATNYVLTWTSFTISNLNAEKYIRIRLGLVSDAVAGNSTGAAGPGGIGEVEDHRVSYLPAPYPGCETNPFLLLDGNLYMLSLIDGSRTFIRTLSAGYNSMGWNTVDNRIYTSQQGVMGSIGQNGATYLYHFYPGITGPLALGDCDTNGNLVIPYGNTAYFLNVVPSQKTFGTIVNTQTLNFAIFSADWAMSPMDAKFYTVEDPTSFRQYDPVTNTSALVTGWTDLPIGNAAFFDVDGNFYVSSTATGSIRRITGLYGGVKDVQELASGNGTTSGNADGCRCPFGKVQIDFGDAPSTYGTKLEDLAGGIGGARAGLFDGENDGTIDFYMGTRVDSETDITPNALGTGDNLTGSNDEELSPFPLSISAGTTYNITLGASNFSTEGINAIAGKITGWLDYNANGIFETSERSVWSGTLAPGASNTQVTLSWPGINTSALTFSSNVYLRIRLSDTSSVNKFNPTGPVKFGEVEDYKISLIASPLPVELVAFDASCDNGEAVLNWATASEENNQYFSVERSTDGIIWNEIARINGAGNSNEILNYSYEDLQPLNGISYYRLTQVDYNGASETFDPYVVHCSGDEDNSILLFPNPAEDEITIRVKLDKSYGATGISIYDITGKKVKEFIVELQEGENTFFFTGLHGLVPGAYTVTIGADADLPPQRLVVR